MRLGKGKRVINFTLDSYIYFTTKWLVATVYASRDLRILRSSQVI